MGQIQSRMAYMVSSQLPNHLQHLIVAHRTDVTLTSLNYSAPLSGSIHELPCHHTAPLPYYALKRPQLTPAVKVLLLSDSVHANC